jgi:ADP-L-glycero-D-manno-heptose 6-epimerase
MILVTGHKGFIGRNLFNHLYLKGEKVIGLDRKDGNVFEQFADIPWKDVTEIYHQGAISSTTEQNVDEIYHHNIKFSIGLFEKAIKHDIRVKYASSGSVYGNSKDYAPNPLNYYAMSKLTIDMWVMENKNRFRKNVTGFRYFNVYGRDENKDDLSTSPIYRFSEQAKDTGIIKIFKGSEKTFRDFVSVEDVIKIITDEHRTGVFDLGTGNPISFLEVAELVAEKYDAAVKFIPMPDIIKGKYQFYTKARSEFIYHRFQSVKEWLSRN